MTINRKTMTVGLAALALVGVTGGGVAWAASDGAGSTPWSSNSRHCLYGQGVGDQDHSPMTTAADYLGITRTELLTRMHAGQSLADVAGEEGKSVAGLKEAIVSAMRSGLDADEDLTPAQRTAMLALLESHLDAMISGTHLGGMDWDDMGGMMGGSPRVGGPGGGMMGGLGGGGMGFGGAMMG